MWKVFTSIFSNLDIGDLMKQTDDWALTKEETIKYQLEWMRALPTGFQIAQRFIGIAFSMVFLVMVLATFTMLCFGMEVENQIDYIGMTMLNPIMIIFSLFFGGGLINSFKKKGNFVIQESIKTKSVGVQELNKVEKTLVPVKYENLSRRQRRKINKKQ